MSQLVEPRLRAMMEEADAECRTRENSHALESGARYSRRGYFDTVQRNLADVLAMLDRSTS